MGDGSEPPELQKGVLHMRVNGEWIKIPTAEELEAYKLMKSYHELLQSWRALPLWYRVIHFWKKPKL